MADGIGLDFRDLAFTVAERAQRRGHRLVDDLEVAAAGELLEFHERKVWLDARRVAIHYKADRAGRREHGGLRVAETIGLAKRERIIPSLDRMRDQVGLRAGGVIERHRIDRERFIARREAMRGA